MQGIFFTSVAILLWLYEVLFVSKEYSLIEKPFEEKISSLEKFNNNNLVYFYLTDRYIHYIIVRFIVVDHTESLKSDFTISRYQAGRYYLKKSSRSKAFVISFSGKIKKHLFCQKN